MNNDLKNIFNLRNKIVIITGAAGLLGEKHAEVIAAYNGTPILIDINKKKIESLAKRLNKKYLCKSQAFKVDITKESEVKSNANFIKKKYKKIDCLINNAANNPSKFMINTSQKKKFEPTRLENFTLDNWNMDINVCLTGSFLCSKYYGEKISMNKSGGTIINIASDLALISPDQRIYQNKRLVKKLQPVKPISYSVVKSGLVGLTRYLATYWSDYNVRCNCLCPGGINNDLPKKIIKEISKRIPLNRMAEPSEYQGTLIWMISDSSKYLNGSIVTVDGGRTTW